MSQNNEDDDGLHAAQPVEGGSRVSGSANPATPMHTRTRNSSEQANGLRRLSLDFSQGSPTPGVVGGLHTPITPTTFTTWHYQQPPPLAPAYSYSPGPAYQTYYPPFPYPAPGRQLSALEWEFINGSPTNQANSMPLFQDTPHATNELTMEHKMLVFVRVIKRLGFDSLGDAITAVLRLRPGDRCHQTVTQSISNFVHQRSREGTRPVDVVRLLYEHPYAQEFVDGQRVRPTFPALPRHARGPDDRTRVGLSAVPQPASTRNAIIQLALLITLDEVDQDMLRLRHSELLDIGRVIRWSLLTAWDSTEIERFMASSAPVSFAVLSTMAVNKRLRKRLDNAYEPVPPRPAITGGPSTAAEATTEPIAPMQQPSDADPLLDQERDAAGLADLDDLNARDPRASRIDGPFPAANEDAQGAQTEDTTEGDTEEAGPDSGIAFNMRRDPWLGVTTIMCMLLYIQYKFNTLFATIVGMLLFISRANHSIFAMCSRIGLSISRSDVLRKLHEIAKDSQKRLDDWIMQNPYGPFDGKVVFDNVNKMARAWDPTLGHRNILRCGTSAIVIKLEDVPEGALRLSPLLENIARNTRSKLTVEELKEDINWAHIQGIGTGHILRTLVKHVPALRRHNSDVEHLFNERYAVHRLRLRKSEITSLRCSGANEATTAGVNEALMDVYDGQLKLSDKRLEDSILIVGGDQLSVDRTRKLQRAVLKGGTNAECGRFLRPQLELWHTKWNNGKNIVQSNWAPTIEAGTFGLRHDCELLQRQLNPTKCDFYPMHGLLEVRFEALTLEGIRLLCEEYTGVVYPESKNLLDCLEKYFGKGGPLADRCFDCLEDMACTLYERYYTETACNHSERDDKWTEARYGPSAAFPPNARLASTADRVVANNANFLRATLWYHEFCLAVAVGDMGRVWEIIKIWRFSFWGTGSTNYGNEMLELACNFLYEFSEKLRIAFMNNWLVNPSGLPGHWQECDLLLEHYNYWIKLLFNAKSLDFDSKFLRECVSFNLRGFSDLRDRFRDIFRTIKSGGRHTPASIAADINKLGEHYRRDMVLVFHRGRTQSYTVENELSIGFNKLDGGQLETFLQRTSTEPFRVTPEELEQLEDEEERVPANPITVTNGVSSLQEFSTVILSEEIAP